MYYYYFTINSLSVIHALVIHDLMIISHWDGSEKLARTAGGRKK
jgi:hypothetical protein